MPSLEMGGLAESTDPARPTARSRHRWLVAGALMLLGAAVFIVGAGRSDRSLAAASILSEIPSIQSWIRSAPQEYAQIIDAELAAGRKGETSSQRRERRTLTFQLVGASKLAHADDALVVRHLRLTIRVAEALAHSSPALCVRLFEHGPDGEIERALPPRLRTEWIRQQGEIMRTPYGSRPRLATADEEITAFDISSRAAAATLGLQLDDFVAAILGRGTPARVCAAHTALAGALVMQGPKVAAGVFRRRVSQFGESQP